MSESETETWLKELGAEVEILTENHRVYRLGKLNAGVIPIRCYVFIDTVSRDFNGNPWNTEPQEEWSLFGYRVDGKVTRQTCERILELIKGTT